ncbi:MAG TPA: hypothetical protein VFN50_07340 [Acidimicrobiales bacterium]|nr:hypothetical protein [Acidimicrobiales bacterium]
MTVTAGRGGCVAFGAAEPPEQEASSPAEASRAVARAPTRRKAAGTGRRRWCDMESPSSFTSTLRPVAVAS